MHGNVVLAGENGRRLKPDFFVRVVLVRDQGHDAVATLKHELQGGVADFAVAEEDDART